MKYRCFFFACNFLFLYTTGWAQNNLCQKVADHLTPNTSDSIACLTFPSTNSYPIYLAQIDGKRISFNEKEVKIQQKHPGDTSYDWVIYQLLLNTYNTLTEQRKELRGFKNHPCYKKIQFVEDNQRQLLKQIKKQAVKIEKQKNFSGEKFFIPQIKRTHQFNTNPVFLTIDNPKSPPKKEVKKYPNKPTSTKPTKNPHANNNVSKDLAVSPQLATHHASDQSEVSWQALLALFFLVLIILKIVNGKTTEEYKKGQLGTCSVCGKVSYPNTFNWKNILRWWFLSKEQTMTCEPCRKERALRKQKFINQINKALQCNFLSREEEQHIVKLAEQYKLKQLLLDYHKTLAFLHRITGYKQGVFPSIKSTDIILKKGEVLHFYTRMQLYQLRHRTRYEGGSYGVSFRIAKGINYRVGSYRGEPIREEYLNLECNGTLYITNQRIIFNGDRNITYKWQDIVQITRFPPNGISISKENKATFHLLKTSNNNPTEYKELILLLETLINTKF